MSGSEGSFEALIENAALQGALDGKLAAEALRKIVRITAALETGVLLRPPQSGDGARKALSLLEPAPLDDAAFIALAMVLIADRRVTRLETTIDERIEAVGEAMPHLDVAALAEASIRGRRP